MDPTTERIIGQYTKGLISHGEFAEAIQERDAEITRGLLAQGAALRASRAS
jgi:hypothetical protein